MSHINFNILHSPRTKHAPAHSPPLRFAAWKPQPCQNLLTTYDGAPLPAKCPQWLSPCSEENGRLQSRNTNYPLFLSPNGHKRHDKSLSSRHCYFYKMLQNRSHQAKETTPDSLIQNQDVYIIHKNSASEMDLFLCVHNNDKFALPQKNVHETHQTLVQPERPIYLWAGFYSTDTSIVHSPRLALHQNEQPSYGHELPDRKSTRLNSSHANISYAVFCLKKKKHQV